MSMRRATRSAGYATARWTGVDSVVATVNDKIAPTEAPTRLRLVSDREAS